MDEALISDAQARQAVAEWRDHQIIAAETLLNLAATHAREKLEAELGRVSAVDSLLNAATLANAKIDALMKSELEEPLAAYLAIAADDLAAIDPRLSALSAAVRQAEFVFPASENAAAERASPLAGPESLEIGGEEPPSNRGLADFARNLQKGVTELTKTAGETADTVLNERVGLIKRVRSAAFIRLDQHWMDTGTQTGALLHQMIRWVDQTAVDARIQLS
ncbi:MULTISPECIES: hypothetical protein [Brevundimonas]|uniref:hypothetical protein n=1 Tax=Brevundimonas TaxID=41275 RepID=UPI0025C6FB08|nr:MULTISPECIES: hypothetical protein [Brevundimonas]